MKPRSILSLDNRLETAAQLVIRARIFYDIWRLYDGAETRPLFIDVMRDYSEFFRFDPHAHFVSFIVHVAALIETAPGTISLPNLFSEIRNGSTNSNEIVQAAELFKDLDRLRSKVMILRSSLFAHRTDSSTYDQVFKRASVTPNELLALTETTLRIINHLLSARGFPKKFFFSTPVEHAKAMLQALSHKEAELRISDDPSS